MPYTIDIIRFPPVDAPERLAFEYPNIAEARKAGEARVAKLMAEKVTATYEVRDHNGVIVDRLDKGATT